MSQELYKITNGIIEVCKNKGKLIYGRELVELLYLAHCHSLDILDKPLFPNTISVFESKVEIKDIDFFILGNCYKYKKSEARVSYSDGLSVDTLELKDSEKDSDLSLDIETEYLLNSIVTVYVSRFEETTFEESRDLSEFINRTGTPVHTVSQKDDGDEISNELIKDYYNNVRDAFESIAAIENKEIIGIYHEDDKSYIGGSTPPYSKM